MPVLFSGEQLEHAAASLRAIPGGVERAAVRAVNRAAVAARTSGISKLSSTYTIKPGKAGRGIIRSTASRTDLEAVISSEGNRIPLTSFDMRPRKPTVRGEPLTFSVRRGSGGKTIGRAFANKTKSGRLMVLQREGSARYPVRGLSGPAIAQMLGEEGVRRVIKTRAQEILDRRLSHEIDNLLKGRTK